MMQSVQYLKQIDDCPSLSESLAISRDVEHKIICMAAVFLKNELPSVPVELVGQQKIDRVAAGNSGMAEELLVLYLATSLLGFQLTGQFSGLSFGASTQEIYSWSLIVKTFYDLKNPLGPEPETGRLFYTPRIEIYQKLESILDELKVDPTRIKE